jgi:hypothetical protein
MRKKATKRGLSPVVAALLLLAVLVVGGIGTIGTLVALGVIGLPTAPPQAPVGVLVPVAGTDIPAYAAVNRDNLLDQAALPQIKWSAIPFSSENVGADWILDQSKIVGRVLRNTKRAGFVFREDDFFPLGTRPGLVGGIPPGKRAMTLDASQVNGLKDLRIGDRFDLVATLPVEIKSLQPKIRSLLVTNGGQTAQPGAGMLAGHTSVQVLVNNGAVVTAAPAEPPAGARPVKAAPQSMTIAVDPAEIGPITEALAAKASLHCVARSGHPDDPTIDNTTPESNPLEGVSIIETLRGKNVSVEAFLPPNAEQPVNNTPGTAAPVIREKDPRRT